MIILSKTLCYEDLRPWITKGLVRHADRLDNLFESGDYSSPGNLCLSISENCFITTGNDQSDRGINGSIGEYVTARILMHAGATCLIRHPVVADLETDIGVASLKVISYIEVKRSMRDRIREAFTIDQVTERFAFLSWDTEKSSVKRAYRDLNYFVNMNNEQDVNGLAEWAVNGTARNNLR